LNAPDRRPQFEQLIQKAYDLLAQVERSLLFTNDALEKARLNNYIQQINSDIATLKARMNNPADTAPIPTDYPFPGGMSADQFDQLCKLLESVSTRTVNTHGGTYGEGPVNISGGVAHLGGTMGDVIYHDNRIIKEADKTYDVRDLPDNPYLGLKDFDYEDREYYAGREALIEQTKESLTTPNTTTTLLFITGASGSGKSSFAKAGLLPALKQFYEQNNKLTAPHYIIRPAAQPLTRLLYALEKLDLNPTEWPNELDSSEEFNRFLAKNTPLNQVNLLVIDQFEESFIQAEGSRELAAFLNILANLADFKAIRTHIIITLRADYISEVFKHKTLYKLMKDGVELWAMSVEELKQAILRPLQRRYPERKDAFESALVQKLAEETSGNEAYLPLLQLTLRQLWRNGLLQLSAYEFFSLPRVVNKWADTVLEFRDFDGQQSTRRTEGERQEILKLLVDLVDVSPTSDTREDVRRTRPRLELEQNSTRRRNLIRDLIAARLLNGSKEPDAQGNTEIEIVDIIHDTLIKRWDELHKAIKEDRQKIKQPQARFELALRLWLDSDKSKERLLQKKVELDEARYLAENKNIALENKEAQEFYQKCLVADQTRRKRRFIIFGSVLTILVIVTSVAVKFGIEATNKTNDVLTAQSNEQTQREEAQRQANAALTAQSNEQTQREEAQRQANAALTAQANEQIQKNEVQHQANAALTAQANEQIQREEAQRQANAALTAQANEQIQREAAQPNFARSLAEQSRTYYSQNRFDVGLLLSLEAIDHKDTLENRASLFEGLFNIRDLTKPIELPAHYNVKNIIFSSNSKTLTFMDIRSFVTQLDIDSRKQLISSDLPESLKNISFASAAFSPDGKTLAIGGYGGTVTIWYVNDPKQIITIKSPLNYTDYILSLAFSPDGNILAFSSSGNIFLWNLATNQQLNRLEGHSGSVLSMAFSPDGKSLASASYDRTSILWDTTTGKQLNQLKGHLDQVNSVAFSPDGKILASASNDHTIILWNPSTGQQLNQLTGHSSWVKNIVFSPDGNILASSDSENIRLWNFTTGQQLNKFSSTPSETNSLAFSPDGKTLVTTTTGKIYLWNLDLKSGQLQACEVAKRNFTQNEWKMFFGKEPYHKTCPELPEGK
jgi:outer membrane protein assembly factor BamB